MYTLRNYQEESVSALFQYFASGKTGNPLVCLPPAAGKSIVIAEFCKRALNWYPKTRILNIVHVKELIEQNHNKLLALWGSAPTGIYSAGLGRRELDQAISFAGIASIARHTNLLGHIDLIIIDEADMLSHREDTQYRQVIAKLKEVNPTLKVIGLTATPYRFGLGMLTNGGIFTDIVVDYCTLEKFNRLIDDGFLCPLVPKQTDAMLNVDNVHMQNGDYMLSELQEAVNKESVTRAALEETVKVAHNRNHWLVYTTGVKHCTNVTNMLNWMGVSSVAVHTDLPSANDARAALEKRGVPAIGDSARDMHINAFKAGYVRAMVGIGIFGVGFDCPWIDNIVMLRPTMSARIWVQYLGRGLRIHPEKTNTLVLDFARNTTRLGCINDPVIPRRPGQKGKPMVPFKLCPECNAYNHTRARVCIDCGFEFPEVFKGSPVASQQELIRREKEESPIDAPPPGPAPVPKKVIPAQIDEFNVDRIDLTKHVPKDPDKATSVKVTYYCGLRIFTEYLFFGHSKGFPKHKAHESWRQMAKSDPPATVQEALDRVDEITPPTTIRVKFDGKNNEVVGYDFGKAVKMPFLDEDMDDVPF